MQVGCQKEFRLRFNRDLDQVRRSLSEKDGIDSPFIKMINSLRMCDKRSLDFRNNSFEG